MLNPLEAIRLHLEARQPGYSNLDTGDEYLLSGQNLDKAKLTSPLIMKTRLLAVLLVLPALLSGCGLSSHLLSKSGPVELIAPETTNLVETVTTNTVYVPAQLNQAGQIVQPASVQPILATNFTPVIHPAVYFTNSQISGLVTGGVKTLDNALAVAGVPWEHTAATGLLALGSLYVAWLNRRTKQKLIDEQNAHADTHEALGTAKAAVGTVLDSFQSLREVAKSLPGYSADLDQKEMHGFQIAQAVAGPDVAAHIAEAAQKT